MKTIAAFGGLWRRALIIAIALLLLATPAGGHAAGTRTPAVLVTPSAPPLVIAPPVLRETHFWSAALQRDMPYAIYLPAGYEGPGTRRYPVLYLLHGLGGSYREWAANGVTETATGLIDRGAIPPMIIVMPEGGRGYWADHANGAQWGTYVSDDLVAHIDETYRTIASRRARAIGGLSMGAHGALDIGLNHPDEFAVIGAHSLALRRHEDAVEFFASAADWTAHDPPSICRQRGDSVRGARLSLWLDVGSADPWVEANRTFHDQLLASGIAHTWHEWTGAHEWAYWRAHEAEYLQFYGDSFRAGTAARA